MKVGGSGEGGAASFTRRSLRFYRKRRSAPGPCAAGQIVVTLSAPPAARAFHTTIFTT
jgi:hypothetical protein